MRRDIMKHPFHNFRSLFPILSDHVHLAACSGSALALPVAKAVDEYQNGLLTSGADWKAHLGRWMRLRKNSPG